MILKNLGGTKCSKCPKTKQEKLRITLCVLYLVEIVLCALPYFQYIDEKMYSILIPYLILCLYGDSAVQMMRF